MDLRFILGNDPLAINAVPGPTPETIVHTRARCLTAVFVFAGVLPMILPTGFYSKTNPPSQMDGQDPVSRFRPPPQNHFFHGVFLVRIALH